MQLLKLNMLLVQEFANGEGSATAEGEDSKTRAHFSDDTSTPFSQIPPHPPKVSVS